MVVCWFGTANQPFTPVVTDTAIRRFFRLLNSEHTLADAARKAGVSEKTARKYKRLFSLPFDVKRPHTWRTRQDPFKDVWPEVVVAKLKVYPGLRATTLFNYLRLTYRGKFREGQLRTLQRRIKQWRAQHGPPKDTNIRQEYVPGERSQSDFIAMNKLNVTIQGEPFKHMLYHFLLPFPAGSRLRSACLRALRRCLPACRMR